MDLNIILKNFEKNFKFEPKFETNKVNLINPNKRSEKLSLASTVIKANPANIWYKKNFEDREDLSSLHRWVWALKLISKK